MSSSAVRISRCSGAYLQSIIKILNCYHYIFCVCKSTCLFDTIKISVFCCPDKRLNRAGCLVFCGCQSFASQYRFDPGRRQFLFLSFTLACQLLHWTQNQAYRSPMIGQKYIEQRKIIRKKDSHLLIVCFIIKQCLNSCCKPCSHQIKNGHKFSESYQSKCFLYLSASEDIAVYLSRHKR